MKKIVRLNVHLTCKTRLSMNKMASVNSFHSRKYLELNAKVTEEYFNRPTQ
jgi:hypothetical protein